MTIAFLTRDYPSIVAGLLAGPLGQQAWPISAMYIEFDNGGSPVTPPAVDYEGKAYYDGLATHPTADYLRVPLTAALVESSDPAKFPKGDRVRYFAQTQGVVGVHGKSFSDAQSSRVYGGALVAVADWADQSRDLVYCRFYYDAAQQIVKLASSQISVTQIVSLRDPAL